MGKASWRSRHGIGGWSCTPVVPGRVPSVLEDSLVILLLGLVVCEDRALILDMAAAGQSIPNPICLDVARYAVAMDRPHTVWSSSCPQTSENSSQWSCQSSIDVDVRGARDRWVPAPVVYLIIRASTLKRHRPRSAHVFLQTLAIRTDVGNLVHVRTRSELGRTPHLFVAFSHRRYARRRRPPRFRANQTWQTPFSPGVPFSESLKTWSRPRHGGDATETSLTAAAGNGGLLERTTLKSASCDRGNSRMRR